MKGIQIKTKVANNMGDTYDGAFVVFGFPTQNYGGYNNQSQNHFFANTLEEFIERGEYTIKYVSYKKPEDVVQNPVRNFPLFTAAGIPVGTVIIKLTSDEQKAFSIDTLNQKVLQHFQKTFGEENVEMVEV